MKKRKPKHRNFYAKAVRLIRPKAVPSKKLYKRRPRTRNRDADL